MTAKDIFMRTLPFCWSKLGLGLLNIVICVVLFAILMGITLLDYKDYTEGAFCVLSFSFHNSSNI